LRAYAGELFVSFHCRMDPATPLAAAYETACRLQTAMLRRLPQLSRVTVHMEPEGRGSPLQRISRTVRNSTPG
jgi:divalent metal cation (Fe/Co/Zn/Cd) transporter